MNTAELVKEATEKTQVRYLKKTIQFLRSKKESDDHILQELNAVYGEDITKAEIQKIMGEIK